MARGRSSIEFDFVDHQLTIQSGDGRVGHLPLEPQSVATFYSRLMAAMTALDLPVRIHTTPNEIADAIPFDRDETHRSYRPRVCRSFLARAGPGRPGAEDFPGALPGQVQPGAFFLGRRRPGGHPLFRPDRAGTSGRHAESAGLGRARSVLARSQQLWVLGRWRPDRLSGLLLVCLSRAARVCGGACAAGRAFYSQELGEFLLPYDRVRLADSPDDTLLEFLQSTYEAAATLADWDRQSLERPVRSGTRALIALRT